MRQALCFTNASFKPQKNPLASYCYHKEGEAAEIIEGHLLQSHIGRVRKGGVRG